MRILLAPLFCLSASVALAQGTPTTEKTHVIGAPPDRMTWGPAG